MPLSLTKTAAEALGMSEGELRQVWAKMPESPFRRVAEIALLERIEVEKAKPYETRMTAAEFERHVGVVEGLRTAVQILQRK